MSKEIEVKDSYTFNRETRKYIVKLKSSAKNIVISENKHKALLRAYSSWDGVEKTLNEISLEFNFPRPLLDQYFKVFNITHSTIPITDEELEDQDTEILVDDLLLQKRFEINQKFEKEDWKNTQNAANLWNAYKDKKVDPFKYFIESFEFPKYKSVPFPKTKVSNRFCLINIADIHVGLAADERYLFFKKGWNTALLQEAMEKYALKVKQNLKERNYKFDAAYCTLGGDIAHSITGFTDKGTKLEAEHLRENQLDYSLTILFNFFDQILRLFPKIYVKAVSGNHDSVYDYAISRFLQTYYRNEPRIEFEITTKRFLPFKITDNNLFVLEHGYAPFTKNRLPKAGSARDSYIQNILLEKPELLQGVKNRYYVTNDQHHLEVQERNQYTMILSPSIVGGDKHSDHSCLKSRAAQNLFIIDDSGLKEIVNLYFD